MNTKTFALLFMLLSTVGFSQEKDKVEVDKKEKDNSDLIKVIDSLYREDQFYFGLAYTMVQSKPANYTQSGFSQSFTGGFLRDFPVNKSRTFGFATGIGYSFSNIKHNLKVAPGIDKNLFVVVEEGESDKDKLEQHSIDIPLELRWRTSVPQSHKFWRVYTGFKMSYVFRSKALYQDSDETYKIIGVKELNKLQYGVYMAAGYNTWNLYAYYALKPIFEAQTPTGEAVKLQSLNLGLMFYIL